RHHDRPARLPPRGASDQGFMLGEDGRLPLCMLVTVAARGHDGAVEFTHWHVQRLRRMLPALRVVKTVQLRESRHRFLRRF
ncbi:hypothetical protein, partial [Acidithiobacillus sp.]|uniref:hypothetical protein n=1 Tax=Acidithiobacillus sp. TaxID=1872118 RepID=UPI003D060009